MNLLYNIGVNSAIQQLINGGVKVVMITGDSGIFSVYSRTIFVLFQEI